MIADNDPTVVDLLRIDLTLEGYDIVATANDGHAAAAACIEHRPDVLIVDYRMPPGPTGVEVVAMVRAADAARAVVLYTNYRSAALVSEAHSAGAILVAKGPLQVLRDTLERLTTRDDETGEAG